MLCVNVQQIFAKVLFLIWKLERKYVYKYFFFLSLVQYFRMQSKIS